MTIFKKLFGKKKKAEEKKQECWYNNAHENGANVVTPGELSQDAGSNNYFECGITQSNAQR